MKNPLSSSFFLTVHWCFVQLILFPPLSFLFFLCISPGAFLSSLTHKCNITWTSLFPCVSLSPSEFLTGSDLLFMLHWFPLKARMSSEGGGREGGGGGGLVTTNQKLCGEMEHVLWKKKGAKKNMKKALGQSEKVWHIKNRGEEARGGREIIQKKVIISARGFAVAQTTNKAEPVGRCAQKKRLKRESEKALESEGTRTENYCAHQQDHFWESVNILSANVLDCDSNLYNHHPVNFTSTSSPHFSIC